MARQIEDAYIVAAWCSWLVPLAAFEIVERLPATQFWTPQA